MASLSMAWRTVDPAGDLVAVIEGRPYTQYVEPLAVKAHVLIARPRVHSGTPQSLVEDVRTGLSVPTCLDLLVVSSEQVLITSVTSVTSETSTTDAILHFLRLADAALKHLGPGPCQVLLAPGDAYVAVISGRQSLSSESKLATARFIHLRDDFNANKLAVDLLKHLLADDNPLSQPNPSLGALVIECR
jgi:hypothetical protein